MTTDSDLEFDGEQQKRRGREFADRAIFAMVIGFGIGILAAYLSAVAGFHGGPAMPTRLFSAPAALWASVMFGDTIFYVVGTVVGTGLWYSFAVLIFATKRLLPAIVLVFGIHAICAAILTVWASW